LIGGRVGALLAVGEELHFGRAAERLGMQQSALSQLVRRMEDQLGFLVF
jgi:DNA-binding transcriptional LysR family regulator